MLGVTGLQGAFDCMGCTDFLGDHDQRAVAVMPVRLGAHPSATKSSVGSPSLWLDGGPHVLGEDLKSISSFSDTKRKRESNN